MALSRVPRPSYQPLTSWYSSLSAKSRLYSILARTSSSWASSVPEVASFHHASLDAFSTGARRCSKKARKLSISGAETKTPPARRLSTRRSYYGERRLGCRSLGLYAAVARCTGGDLQSSLNPGGSGRDSPSSGNLSTNTAFSSSLQPILVLSIPLRTL